MENSKKCVARTRKPFKDKDNGFHNTPPYNHFQLPLFNYSNHLDFINPNYYYPHVLPPHPLPFHLPVNAPTLSLDPSAYEFTKHRKKKPVGSNKYLCIAARRPDSGGVEGTVIPLIANHFRVRFSSATKIYHYNIDINPQPSKEIARRIKQKLIQDNSHAFHCSSLAYDGRRNLYSPSEFQADRLELYVSLPIFGDSNNTKLFRISIKLVSKLDGNELARYLNKESDDGVALPQDYLQALDIILREAPLDKCVPVGRSLYSNSTEVSKEIGGGVVGMRGFFQSLRPTQQGLSLNMDLSVAAFHESVGVISYLQKRVDFLDDLAHTKSRALSGDERREVENTLRNLRVFVCHRETVERYRVYGLTDEATEDLFFPGKDGRSIRLVAYYKEHYNYNIQFRKLPCLKTSRGKPCHLPMELCMICEGQKFLGKLSDEQTAKLLKMSCQKPKSRRSLIDGVMQGPAAPTSEAFKMSVSKEMTRLTGRVLQPPKLRLGDGGLVRDLIPFRQDRQWNLLNSHVFEGTKIDRWALVSFGGSSEQRSNIPKFIHQLSHRCQQLGIFLNKNTFTGPVYEPNHVLNNVSLLEGSLKAIQNAAFGSLQLIICIMEKKHKGYADLKRIAETKIGVVSQCCLYPNLGKLNSQFLANLALKINAKVGGCTVALYSSLESQIPRLFTADEPVIFMGADVTHPHPLDDVSPSVAAVVGSMNWPAANKYVSRMRSQTHRQEIIQDLTIMVKELLEEFLQEVNKLPSRVIFFRDGVSETQFRNVLQEELEAIQRACATFHQYNPPITFSVVQKRHHTRLFPDENSLPAALTHLSDENIPPGTVVDTVITHPREFDFYLCSHLGVKGTSRPTHYHVLWDDNMFTSDELQKLVYNLCFTFVRCTKPVSLVPPVYYAHLAAYRGRLYLERPELCNSGRNNSAFSRASPPETTPLPKLSEKLRNLMFYC